MTGNDAVAGDAAVTVVTVTYGDRWEAGLARTLASVLSDPRLFVIVVLNGAGAATRARLDAARAAAPGRLQLIDLGANRGSAPAFADGLAAAYLRGAPVLLLDDDNPLPGDAIERLAAITRQADVSGEPPTALACYRAVNPIHALLRDGASVASCFAEMRPGAFLSTDVFPARRTPAADERLSVETGDRIEHLVELPNAMWGGLYLPLSIVRLGILPPAELVLYADDNAFSGLLRDAGCRIRLCLDIEIVDTVDWRESAEPPRSPLRIPRALRTPRAEWWRVQYQSRNAAHLSVVRARTSRRARARLAVNASTRLSLLLFAAVISGRLPVYLRILRASLDGLRGRLGPSYPLPGSIEHPGDGPARSRARRRRSRPPRGQAHHDDGREVSS